MTPSMSLKREGVIRSKELGEQVPVAQVVGDDPISRTVAECDDEDIGGLQAHDDDSARSLRSRMSPSHRVGAPVRGGIPSSVPWSSALAGCVGEGQPGGEITLSTCALEVLGEKGRGYCLRWTR